MAERTRRDVLIGGLATLAACGGPPTQPSDEAPVAPDPFAALPTGERPRNVVVVLTDDQRWDSLGFLGHPFLKTPSIDRLAREGAHCPDAFVTTSLCCPSRASMLTGLYAHAHGVLDNKDELDAAFPTWNQIAARAGHDTAFFGKWHMGGGNPHPRPGWKKWVGFRGQGRYDYPGADPDPLDRAFSVDGELKELQGYVTDLITDHAVDWLKSRQGDVPFAMVVSHKAVHAPFQPADRHRDAFADVPIPPTLPDTDAAYAHIPDWLRKMRQGEFGVDRPYKTWPDFGSWYRDYHRTLLAVDDSVGRLLQVLDEKGLLDSTVVLYTSDNGFMFGEQGVLDKRNFYEASIRVPLMMMAPGLIAPGTRFEKLALNVDLAPTILEWLGLRAPEHWHGRSMAPLLAGKDAPPWRQEFVYEYFFERWYPSTPTLFGLRTKRMKLATTWGFDEPDQLFDLETDPQETTNLAGRPEYAERQDALTGRLRNHLLELGMLDRPVWGVNWIRTPEEAAAPPPAAPPAAKAKAGKRKAP